VHGLLDTDAHPQARFVSDSVTPRDAMHAQVCGRLTLHGVTRPVCMDATLNALRRHPMPPFRRTAGFSATARLDRFDYGITSWPTVIGREVAIRIELEASRGIGAPESTPTNEDAPS
jgi:polyisoprenoid-binding protein YceI